MKRRQFLQYIPGFGFLLLEFNHAFGKSLAKSLFGRGNDELTVYPPGDIPPQHIPISWQYDIAYVSAPDLARAFRYHTYFNREKQKLVIYLPHNKVVVGAGNPFLMIDDKPVQMPIESMWLDNEVFIPVAYFVPLVNRYTNLKLEYNHSRQELRGATEKYNTAGVNISSRDNGIVIRIRSSRKFGRGELSMDMRNDWLHVDMYGAHADIKQISNTPGEGSIREVKAFQFKDLLSVAFRLRKEPVSKELYQDDDTNDVAVILRYDESIAESDLKEEDDLAIDEEIEKQLEEDRKRWLIDTVAIDPGHGGKDPGALGVGNMREKEVVLAIALKLGDLIKKKMPGVKVVYTRNDDRFVELRRRTQIANENNAKVFISIHANSNRSRRPSGFESYILGPEKGNQASYVVERENSVIRFESPKSQKHYQGINKILASLAQTAFMKHSEHLAANVQKEMAQELRSLNLKSRGVKQAPFWVMVGASMPSVLIETGFITNAYDARILRTRSHQQKIAEGIFDGLKKFKQEYESAI